VRKATILIVGAFPPSRLDIFGGIVTTCTNLVESSFADRFDLVLVDSTQRSNPPPGILLRFFFAVRRSGRYCRVLLRCRPNAVVLFCSVGASLVEKAAMAVLARFLGIPALIFPQGGRLIEIAASSRFNRLWIRCALKRAPYFLCQGPTWQRFAVDVVGFAPFRAPIVPNWTATNSLLSIGSSRAACPPGRAKQLIFVGWLEREKGIFELLEACARLSDKYEFRLVVAGKGHAEKSARKFVRDAGLSDHVEFVGWVSREALQTLLTASDIFVLPSWAEGLPNAMIEAMAAGLAVIVSEVGNIPDVVIDGREALVIPPQSSEAVEEAIRRLLDEPALLSSIATRGHELAKHRYAVESAVEKLSQVLDSVISPSASMRTYDQSR
jgi:glycosyltransferase involved in cell wall biosynthesis